MRTDESHLIERIRSGDAEAFGEIYEIHSPGVFNIVLRMVGNRDDAEDIKQEVFLKAHQALRSFKGKSRLSTWLYRVATNVCLDELRRRRPAVSAEALAEDSRWEPVDSQPAHNPEEQLRKRLTQEAVRSALMEMKPHYRILIVLKHLEGLSYEEIAAIVGCSVNSLNVRLHRARRSFQKAIAPYLSFEDAGELQEEPKQNIVLP